eukprot:g15996.t1
MIRAYGLTGDELALPQKESVCFGATDCDELLEDECCELTRADLIHFNCGQLKFLVSEFEARSFSWIGNFRNWLFDKRHLNGGECRVEMRNAGFEGAVGVLKNFRSLGRTEDKVEKKDGAVDVEVVDRDETEADAAVEAQPSSDQAAPPPQRPLPGSTSKSSRPAATTTCLIDWRKIRESSSRVLTELKLRKLARSDVMKIVLPSLQNNACLESLELENCDLQGADALLLAEELFSVDWSLEEEFGKFGGPGKDEFFRHVAESLERKASACDGGEEGEGSWRDEAVVETGVQQQLPSGAPTPTPQSIKTAAEHNASFSRMEQELALQAKAPDDQFYCVKEYQTHVNLNREGAARDNNIVAKLNVREVDLFDNDDDLSLLDPMDCGPDQQREDGIWRAPRPPLLQILHLSLAHNPALFRHLPSMQRLCDGLKANLSLQSLDLRATGLQCSQDVGTCASYNSCAILADMLASNHTIQVLDLSSNDVYCAGVIALSKGLEKNTGLRELKLNCNEIADLGCKSLFERMIYPREVVVQQQGGTGSGGSGGGAGTTTATGATPGGTGTQVLESGCGVDEQHSPSRPSLASLQASRFVPAPSYNSPSPDVERVFFSHPKLRKLELRHNNISTAAPIGEALAKQFVCRQENTLKSFRPGCSWADFHVSSTPSQLLRGSPRRLRAHASPLASVSASYTRSWSPNAVGENSPSKIRARKFRWKASSARGSCSSTTTRHCQTAADFLLSLSHSPAEILQELDLEGYGETRWKGNALESLSPEFYDHNMFGLYSLNLAKNVLEISTLQKLGNCFLELMTVGSDHAIGAAGVRAGGVVASRSTTCPSIHRQNYLQSLNLHSCHQSSHDQPALTALCQSLQRDRGLRELVLSGNFLTPQNIPPNFYPTTACDDSDDDLELDQWLDFDDELDRQVLASLNNRRLLRTIKPDGRVVFQDGAGASLSNQNQMHTTSTGFGRSAFSPPIQVAGQQQQQHATTTSPQNKNRFRPGENEVLLQPKTGTQKYLDFTGPKATLFALREALTYSRSLRVLRLRGCRLKSRDVAIVCAGLRVNQWILEVDLGSNFFGSRGGEAVALVLGKTQKMQLTELDLSGNERIIGRVAAAQGGVQTVGVSGPDCASAFLRQRPGDESSSTAVRPQELSARTARPRPTTTHDYLHNNINHHSSVTRGFAAICEVLRNQNTVLKCLNLSSCNLGNAGCDAVGRMLQGNETLTQINLANNEISAVTVLADALRYNNQSLTVLNLNNNALGNTGVMDLASALGRVENGFYTVPPAAEQRGRRNIYINGS